MSRVFFLGAGASIDAGYPLMAKLLNAVDYFCASSQDASVRNNWNVFECYRKDAEGALQEILYSPDVELIFTLPDILEAALGQRNSHAFKMAVNAAKNGDDTRACEENEWFGNNTTRTELEKASLAKLALQRTLEAYFSYKHCADNESGCSDRDYLRVAFALLEHGDTIITTNWDTLAERALIDLHKWCPADGYGFPVELLPPKVSKRQKNQHKPQSFPQSIVKVLKLHGSVGWFEQRETGKVYLRYPSYLQYLGAWSGFHDATAPQPGSGPDSNPVVLGPSYIKQFDIPELQSIWAQASRALNDVEEITVVGYSLPAGDAAIRGLLNPLRDKINDGVVKVTVVVGPDDKTSSKRWRDFWGVETVRKTARDHFLTSVKQKSLD